MRKVVCWHPEEVYSVINIDADAVPPSIFWAVDTDAPVRLAEGEQGVRTEVSTDTLIERFLDPTRLHVQMAVLGPSGAGKSHLIRRLQNRIEGRPGLEVLVVQRLQTNLRAILELLIQRLPEDAQARYREDLAGAGYTLIRPDVQKGALLDGLAQAIQEDVVRPDSGLDSELEAELLVQLPNLFRDPYLRGHKFLNDGEIVPELVDRLFSSREGKRIDERLLFGVENLPFDAALISASAPARNAIDLYLYDQDSTVPPVLSVINRNLNRAISRTLNFSGERLTELMRAIREHLFQEGRELVLLFEEFARLQGYDGAMLEALLEAGNPDGPRATCNVRWAVACTSGRFKELPTTVRTRMNFLVDMEDAPPQLDLSDFAGKYLNAVRLGRTMLDNAKPVGIVPNACGPCQWRPECHQTFGDSADGYGLYPFTASALSTMKDRKGQDPEKGRLNPRLFQRYVLQAVLAEEGPNIAADAFPNRALLERMGGLDHSFFSAIDGQRLRERTGTKYERYLALTQLWSGGRYANPPVGIAEAFGLETLVGFDAPPPPPPPGGKEEETIETGPLPGTPPSEEQQQLAAWVEGGQLDQNVAQNIRVKLYDLIERAIDWDQERLLPGTFTNKTGATHPFSRRSINFVNQGTGGGLTGAVSVQFTLPFRKDDRGFAMTAATLAQLLIFDRTRDWEQSGGLEAMAAVSEIVADCAAEVLRQLRTLRSEGGAWDPLAAAVELLLVGAALGGALPATPTDAQLIAGVFASIQDDSSGFGANLKVVYDFLKRHRPALIKLVRAHVSGSKGGQPGRFVDPLIFRNAARRLRRSKWVLTGQPTESKTPYRELDAWYLRVSNELGPALNEEKERRGTWLDEVRAAFGNEENRQTILNDLKAMVDGVTVTGLGVGRNTLKALTEARDAFASIEFAAAVRAAATLRLADPPESELVAFGRGGKADAVSATRALIKAWGDFLIEAEVEAAVREAEQGIAVLESERERLNQALEALEAELAGLEGANVAS
jgi:hypothetical protein